jgi:hypothetical protein
MYNQQALAPGQVSANGWQEANSTHEQGENFQARHKISSRATFSEGGLLHNVNVGDQLLLTPAGVLAGGAPSAAPSAGRFTPALLSFSWSICAALAVIAL